MKSKNTVWDILGKYYPEDKFDKINFFENYLSKHIQQNDVVLDAGCGHKSFKNKNDNFTKKFFLIGCDYVFEDAKKNKDINFGVTCDLIQMPFRDDSFNIIFCKMVLEHIKDPSSFWKEIERVLKPNGYFIFITSNKYNIVSIVSRLIPNRFHGLLAKKILSINENDTFPTYYKLNTNKDLKKNKLHCLDIAFIQPPPYFVSFSKALTYLMVGWYRLINRYDILETMRGCIVGCFQKVSSPPTRET